MNVFRLAGDLSHLLAIIILLLKIWKTRSCAGISGKSQILFALVYTTRYLDLLSNFISLYNSVMKIVFIGASWATLYLMYVKFKATYDRNHDTFRIEFLVIPVIILSLVVNHDFTPLEILWTFSIYLESVAILPQLFMVSKTGEAETITSHYLFCLGSYRGLYILNWVYRYYSEGFYDLIAIIAGIVQTVLYCDFFYLYITKVIKGKALKLPAQGNHHVLLCTCLIRKQAMAFEDLYIHELRTFTRIWNVFTTVVYVLQQFLYVQKSAHHCDLVQGLSQLFGNFSPFIPKTKFCVIFIFLTFVFFVMVAFGRNFIAVMIQSVTNGQP